MSAEPTIEQVRARRVWDSRGRPTIEVEVELEGGATGRSIAPSGASTGSREALDLRDGGSRFGGFDVTTAIAGVEREIAPALRGMDPSDQAGIDKALIDLDGTRQKTRLGGNALVATSSAVAWAAAAGRRRPLWRHLADVADLDPADCPIPLPMIQIFGGGAHAGRRTDIQDYLVMCPGAESFAEALEWTAEVYLAAGKDMAGRAGVCDEGGHWPDFSSNEEGLARLTRAIEQAGFSGGEQVGIALDVAASEFQRNGVYELALEGRALTTPEMSAMVAGWCEDYPVISVEDPFGENDTEGFVMLTEKLGARVQIVGDDYLTTDAPRVHEAATVGAGNAVLLKANQCGTLSELLAALRAARSHGWNTVVSGRSGESEDVTLSHLALGFAGQQVKVGSIARSERAAKWNELIRIEDSEPSAAALWRYGVPASSLTSAG